MANKLNIEEIKRIIPHRSPMLLIDEVLDMEGEKNITAKYFVDPECEILKGHFPKAPVFPGVYTVEIMAQASDILILSCERYAGKEPLFIGIDKVKFLRKINPGDTLKIHSEIISEREEKAIVKCYAEVFINEEISAVGEITLAMR